jgi:protocatechuate 3,4-dioxygenase beta subunit
MNQLVLFYGVVYVLFAVFLGFKDSYAKTAIQESRRTEVEERLQTSPPSQPSPCKPTPSAGLGPFYEPDAPERMSVGEGHVLSGVVRSSTDCSPIEGARIEFWLAGPDGKYSNDYRATMFSKKSGEYRFESHFPPPYSGRPSHIHIKVEAKDYQPLITQFYPVKGQFDSKLDLVLVPIGL